MIRVAVLMTVHNRRQLTIHCLTSLRAAIAKASDRLELAVYMVDDGCTDGTAEEVRQRFPEVIIIPGNGNLYWCGGMRLAWSTASNEEYDAYLWLNDDVTLREDALVVLLDTLQQQVRQAGLGGIVVGGTATRGTDSPSYGAISGASVLQPGDTPKPIRLFNGNILLVTAAAFRKLGNLSHWYSHAFGDLDYAIRAERDGVPVWLAPGFLGECDTNRRAKWERPEVPLLSRLRELHRPTGCPPWELACLMWQDRSWWAPWTIAKLYLRALFPRQSD